ncbi:MAG: hypothetical protein EZS28_011310 [Streblomastix strix]|uniref:RanBP2-type domain-containing protein n=1 Tax=Streblomastix strix TaxID=222440 RepID=A0A5J4WDU7_9EUKA|nr:MAG: hypothetical protein EZS28_011310 [Streblomastix strix]
MSRPGDWFCPQCQELNYSFRDVCFSCGVRKPGGRGRGGYEAPIYLPPNIAIGGISQEWLCAQCRTINSIQQAACIQCGAMRGSLTAAPIRQQTISPSFGQQPQEQREGDWYCSSCGNFNFAFRETCQNCPGKRSESNRIITLTNQQRIYEIKGKPGDWTCPNCKSYNYSFRSDCFRCGNKKQ